MSAMTTSSVTTCLSHQESAWWAAKARQESVIVEAVRKGLLTGDVRILVEHIYQCFLSVLSFPGSARLGEKASDVEQCWGASAKLPDRRPRPHWTGRVLVNEGIMFGELRFFSLLFCFWGVCMGVWEWMCEWMSLECNSCAQTLDRGQRCLGPDLQCPR